MVIYGEEIVWIFCLPESVKIRREIQGHNGRGIINVVQKRYTFSYASCRILIFSRQIKSTQKPLGSLLRLVKFELVSRATPNYSQWQKSACRIIVREHLNVPSTTGPNETCNFEDNGQLID